MIGIIVTGHGGFATGLAKNVKMLSGVEVTAVDFTEDITPEVLDEKLANAIASFDALKNIVVFTDIPGGTPYNRAVTVSLTNPKVRVVAGTNTPMLLDAAIKNIADEEFDSTDELADAVMAMGKEGITKFVMPVLDNNDDFDDEDGI